MHINIGDVTEQVVPPTMLVREAGRQRSVPRGCIGRKARAVSMTGGQIRVAVAEGGADLARAVAEMTQVEAGARTERITRLRIRSSGLPCVKTLADFDWTFQPSVPRPLLEEPSTLGFIERAENVLLVGSPGVGKTRLAVAIGVEAARSSSSAARGSSTT